MTHPLYSCLTDTDLYPPLLLCHCYLNSYSCLTVFLTPPFHSFPCAPFYSFPHSFPCSPVLQFYLVPLSHSFPCFPLSGLRWPLFLIWTPSCISNVHRLLAYKHHVAVRGGPSSFLFVPQPLLTVQSTGKSCIFCYTAIHHFCCYTAERLPTCPYPAQWYCYLSCDLRCRLIYWDILVFKVYLVTKQVSR